MGPLRGGRASPGLLVVLAVGVTLGGLLAGYEPVGGDPDRLYRPIKAELARSLREGTLPFWSDRFGLGVPLVAESHVAAFYPPNWVLYRALDVPAAYRLSMWLHYLALAAATYAYARRLGLLPWGSALASLAFVLCGFQAIHSSHEPLYSALPFLVIALYLTEDYVASGRRVSAALLAVTWGAQLTLGHFQIAAWTAGLVIATGLWRLVADGHTRTRAIGLAGALAWGAGIASIQLVLSWDQAQILGTVNRSVQDLMFYAYPPAHVAELAIPRLFAGLPGGPEDPYWFAQGTTGYEASLYIGTIPLILACIGLASPGDRALAPWRLIAPASFALATMPLWWPLGYQLFLLLPGLGYFRAPGRFTAITALGLALLAGRGFDRTLSSSRWAVGLGLATAFGAAAALWAIRQSHVPPLATALVGVDLAGLLGVTAIVWISSLAAIAAWRWRAMSPAVPFALALLELGFLYFHSTTVWGWSADVARNSPVLRRLAQETTVGTVAGDLGNLPVWVRRAPTYPYLGMGVPLPSRALDFSRYREATGDPRAARLLRRMGTTHAVWPGPVSGPGIDVLYTGPDEVLDRLAFRPAGASEPATWFLVRYPDAPAVRVALRALDAPDIQTVFAYLVQDPSTETAWFLPGDRPADTPGPRARSARILRWNGLDGEVAHDGTCDVVIRRTYAPGWTVRINGGRPLPVARVDGGLQSVRLTGTGPTRIALAYQPPRLAPAALGSGVALAAALIVIGGSVAAARRRPRPMAPRDR